MRTVSSAVLLKKVFQSLPTAIQLKKPNGIGQLLKLVVFIS